MHNPRKDAVRRSIRLWWHQHCLTVVGGLGLAAGILAINQQGNTQLREAQELQARCEAQYRRDIRDPNPPQPSPDKLAEWCSTPTKAQLDSADALWDAEVAWAKQRGYYTGTGAR